MDIKRLILFVIFSFSILMLWDSWQKKHEPAQIIAPLNQAVSSNANLDASIPNASNVVPPPANNLAITNSAFKLESAQRVSVDTDLFHAEIDTLGGDLRRLTLNKHRASDSHEHFVLLDDASKPMLYVAQTGLTGAALPNHKSLFTTTANSYTMATDAKTQEVRFSWVGSGTSAGINVDKIYIFHRNSYVIDVTYQINNASSAAINPSVYYQILHDNKSNQGSKMMPTFTGGAYYTEADKFKKITFSDMEKKKFSKANDGWVGLVQHYFAGAWIPKAGLSREYYTDKLSDSIYSIGAIAPIGNVLAGAKTELTARLFAGPQTQADLLAAAPGLEYTVDYGFLTIVAKPIFWLLTKIQAIVVNWGVAIILLTVLIKSAFYPLSAASYKSMAKMRELAPRLQTLKEKFGDDRQKMQQAMMELYKTEKINPMGGCLPILVQVPVFISLYWVLLGSIDLRHAPFFGWIHDLSAPDTFFGSIPNFIPLLGGMPIGLLPVLMGATMIIQTKLNPKPTDPMQAKVMQIMPIVFSIFFFFFPAGLVLYWLVNNILSISQQWFINKTIHAEAIAKKSGIAKA